MQVVCNVQEFELTNCGKLLWLQSLERLGAESELQVANGLVHDEVPEDLLMCLEVGDAALAQASHEFLCLLPTDQIAEDSGHSEFAVQLWEGGYEFTANSLCLRLLSLRWCCF